MEKLLSLYFGELKDRYKLITHLYYLGMVGLISNKLLNHFAHIYYIPCDVNWNRVIYFFTSGQIIFPMVAFLITSVLMFIGILGFAYFISIFTFSRWYKKTPKNIKGLLQTYGFIKIEGERVLKGKRFKKFKEYANDLNSDSSILIKLRELYCSCILSTLICFWCYGIFTHLSYWFVIPINLYGIVIFADLISIYALESHVKDIINILLEVEQ